MTAYSFTRCKAAVAINFGDDVDTAPTLPTVPVGNTGTTSTGRVL